MRRLVTLVLFAPWVALFTGCRDRAEPTGIAPSAEALATKDPMGSVHRLPASLEQKVQSFRADLEARGYEVARGYWTLWGAEDCKYPIHTLGMCYGNNPTSPYALAVVPTWRQEFRDQSFQHLLTQAQRNMSATFRMSDRDALVVFAQMPPSARYFGIQSNVFTRRAAVNTEDRIYKIVAGLGDSVMRSILFGSSPDPSRMMLVASIGNSINNVVMQGQSGPPWGLERYFVVTPDAGMAGAMTAALVRAGVTSDEVFTEPVAPGLVRTGLGSEADDFITYIRYSLPADEAAGEAWREQLPLTILRVRPRSEAGQPQPFAVPAYFPRSANFDETVLANDRQALVTALMTRWGQPVTPAPFFSLYQAFDLVGQHCLGYPDPNRGPMDCLGDTQDSDYDIGPFARLDSGQVIAVVGTLGTETGNATYASLSVNWFPQLVGVANLSDPQLLGTAAEFASVLQNDARLFYLYYFARDCTGLRPYLEISKQQVPKGGLLRMIQRNYVNPGSAGGPDPTKILKPVALVFDGRNRPTQ